MTPRIVLVRHGRSAHVHRGGWVGADGFRRWYAAYDRAGVDPTDAPPAALAAEAAHAGVVATSDAPRALASAERLALGTRPVVSPLLREIEVHPPTWVRWRMPLGAWALAIGVEWLRERVGDPRPLAEDRARAAVATDWLADLAAGHGGVLAVTHAAVRRRIASALTTGGWRLVNRRGGHRPWSSWRFTRGHG